MLQKNLILMIFLVCISCSTTMSGGPVDNEVQNIKIQIVDRPAKYEDTIIEIKNIENQLAKYESSLDRPITLNDKGQERFFSYLEAYDFNIQEQDDISKELLDTGKLELIPGRSYSFLLESFCVHAKTPRPVKGDGFKIDEIKGPAKEYLPSILENYAKFNITHDELQSLVWSLLAGLRFDELTTNEQKNLMLFFQDAPTRFGNRQIEKLGQDIFNVVVPNEIQDQINEISQIKQDILKYRENFKELEEIMAPEQLRAAIEIGWMRTDEGYFIKLSSENGYSQVKVEIYVPYVVELRSPQSQKKIFFIPSKYIALPGSGQRLGLSNKTIKIKKKSVVDFCERLKKWRPNQCKEISNTDREKILIAADPKNFPLTRYSSPPDSSKMIEEETDCSHFTHAIYRRSGIAFPYTSTSNMRCLNNFKKVSSQEAKPGDLILYKKHVGILSKNKTIISAGIGGPRRRSALDPNDEDFIPSIRELRLDSFGSPTFYQWSCK